MRRFLRVGAFIALNVVIVVALLEIALRLAAPALPPALAVPARWVMTGQPYAQDWTPAWQQNREHYYVLRPGIEDELQYGSASVSFSLSTIELWEGGGIGFRTDPVDFFVDAVVVGDSFGMCFTEREDCWVEQLAAQRGLGIVNLSQPVTGSRSHARILRDFGAPLEPPLVIWQFFGNDFNDDYGLAVFREEIAEIDANEDATTGESGSLLNWLRRNSVLVAIVETLSTGRFTGVPEGERLFVKPHVVAYGENDEHTLRFGGLYEQQALDMEREQNQIGYGYSAEAFQEAQALVQGWDGELVVVLIPTREEVYAHLTEPIMGAEAIAALASAREAMLGLCAELGLRCFDPLETFQARALAGEALYYEDDMHLNPHGNAVLAGALHAWLDSASMSSP